MAQNVLTDPFVASGPTRSGTGNGTLSVDRLTHFTVTQTYTATCIAKTPDTIFNISGDLDGSVGIAVVGTQFFDQDLKVFLTIQQGSTVFEVGDQFTFTVINGTDLNQANIDTYDELFQKNFGPGVRGAVSGDHSMRYIEADLLASLVLGDIQFTAVTAGLTGDAIQVEYLSPVAASAASLVRGDLTFTARTAGAAGNSITVEYLAFTPAVKAEVTIQAIRYRAALGGTAGNSLTIAYTTGATAGSEIVSVVGNAISVQIQSGVSTATQVLAAINGSPAALALITASITGVAGSAQTAPVSPTAFTGGIAAIGDAGNEVVSVTGTAIQVTLENLASTATQVKAAIDAFPAASALISVSITGTGSNVQSTPVAAANLVGGANGVGNSGFETITVTGNLISLRIDPYVTAASVISALVFGNAPASALVTTTIIGSSSNAQAGPVSATHLSGGRNKNYSLNHNELTDAGNFIEGNASLEIKDLAVAQKMSVGNHAQFNKTVGLNDSNSGTAVANTQLAMNRLRGFGRLTIETAGDKVLWSSGVLNLASLVSVKLHDTGVTNTLTSASYSLSDGQSLFLLLKPETSSTITASVGSSSTVQTAFRLGTRIGTNFVWFNGVVQRDRDLVRLGGVVDYREQLFMTISGGGFLTHDASTPGLITWPADINVRPMGSSAVLTVLASNTTLSDGQMAYISLADPIATANVGVTLTTLTASNMARVDRFWLFYRAGNTVFFRNGTSIEQGESAHIQCIGSASANVANAIVRRDSNGDIAVRNITSNKVLVAPGTGNGLDVTTAGDLNLGASVGANNVNIGSASSTTHIKGNLEVEGTTTTVDSTTVTTVDPNITINKGGTDGSSEGSGITVDRAGTKGSLIYAVAAATRWKLGDLGSEVEIADISTAQTFSNKTLNNTTVATVKDTNFTIQDDGDATKQAKFQASGITAATTRVFSLPDFDTTLVGTTGAQTLSDKTFTSALTFDTIAAWIQQTDSTTTGTAATASTPTKSVVRYTNASLVSVTGVTAPATAELYVFANVTGASVTILNDAGTAANRILTGTGQDMILANNATLILFYDLTTTKWRIVGGSGSGANQTLSNLTAPTAINADLLPDAIAVRSLGSSTKAWLVGWMRDVNLVSTVGTFSASLTCNGISLPSGGTADVGLVGLLAKSLGFVTASNGAADAAATPAFNIETGNKTAGTGNSGAITLQTGTSTGGTRGDVNLNARRLNHNGETVLANGLVGSEVIDSTTTGAAQTLAFPTTLGVQLTNGSLTSITGVTAPTIASSGNIFVLSNVTGNSVLVLNDVGTAANKILTGTAADLTLAANASLWLMYNYNISKWQVIGGSGSGGGGGSSNPTLTILAGENLTANDAVYISVGAADSRTAGRIYKIDATNDNRMEFLGFVTTTVTTGNSATVQLAGELSGFTGLTVGEPIYASVTTLGGNQTAAPSVNGQWIVQLGIATSASKVAINGSGSATATKISSSGFGSVIPFVLKAFGDSGYVADVTVDVIEWDTSGGDVTQNLPAASSCPGKIFHIKNTGVGQVIIDGNGSDTLDGELTITIRTQWDTRTIYSNGTSWRVL